ncbi:MAG: fructose-bisphosphatase class III [Lachnospiraceae bacterium]|nr:fructose-bisphosphatase class III [Lachnospiraceae bacterium]
MRTFVLSDIHGYYDTYLKMLKEIGFSDDDFLYVIGDVIDRGPSGIQIIRDIMNRKNVELFLGNHELMMLNAIDYQRKKEQGLVKEDPFDDHLTPYELWTHPANGGDETFGAFYRLKKEEQDEVEDYLKSLRLIKRIKVGGHNFHLSHSYSLERRFGKEFFYKEATKKEAEMIVWESPFEQEGDPYITPQSYPFAYKGDTYIVGHIFTQRLNHVDQEGRGKIFKEKRYRGYRIIDMDCGMALNSKSSRLGCMQLETGQEYYVPLME